MGTQLVTSADLPLIHVVWVQGWENAPAKAVDNSSTWEALGKVCRWSAENSRHFVDQSLLAAVKSYPPATTADIILLSAVLRFGGYMVGADCRLLRPGKVGCIVRDVESREKPFGLHVWQGYQRRPYSGEAYFSANHPWPLVMVAGLYRDLIYRRRPMKNSFAVAGPGAWLRRMKEHPGLLKGSTIRQPGKEVFLREPNDRSRRTPGALMDPGLYGSWLGSPHEGWGA